MWSQKNWKTIRRNHFVLLFTKKIEVFLKVRICLLSKSNLTFNCIIVNHCRSWCTGNISSITICSCTWTFTSMKPCCYTNMKWKCSIEMYSCHLQYLLYSFGFSVFYSCLILTSLKDKNRIEYSLVTKLIVNDYRKEKKINVN